MTLTRRRSASAWRFGCATAAGPPEVWAGAPTWVPQLRQNRAPLTIGVPQDGQPDASAEPQLKQKRAPDGLAVPQAAQVIGARSGTGPRAQSTGRAGGRAGVRGGRSDCAGTSAHAPTRPWDGSPAPSGNESARRDGWRSLFAVNATGNLGPDGCRRPRPSRERSGSGRSGARIPGTRPAPRPGRGRDARRHPRHARQATRLAARRPSTAGDRSRCNDWLGTARRRFSWSPGPEPIAGSHACQSSAT